MTFIVRHNTREAPEPSEPSPLFYRAGVQSTRWRILIKRRKWRQFSIVRHAGVKDGGDGWIWCYRSVAAYYDTLAVFLHQIRKKRRRKKQERRAREMGKFVLHQQDTALEGGGERWRYLPSLCILRYRSRHPPILTVTCLFCFRHKMWMEIKRSSSNI